MTTSKGSPGPGGSAPPPGEGHSVGDGQYDGFQFGVIDDDPVSLFRHRSVEGAATGFEVSDLEFELTLAKPVEFPIYDTEKSRPRS